MKHFFCYVTIWSISLAAPILAQGKSPISDIISILDRRDALELEKHSQDSLVLQFSIELDESIGEADPLKYTFSGKMAVPLDGKTRPNFIKYSCVTPSLRENGEAVGSFVERGIASYKDGIWSHYENDLIIGGHAAPVNKLTISQPGYDNSNHLISRIIQYGPMNFILHNDPERLRVRFFEDVGMVGMLRYLSQHEGVSGLRIEEKEGRLIITQGHPDSGVSQITEYDPKLALSPLRMHFHGPLSETDRTFERWDAGKHSFHDGVGWIPRVVEGDRLEDKDRRKFRLSVDSIDVLDSRAVKELFKQEVGPGWTIEDQRIGETFKLGTAPS